MNLLFTGFLMSIFLAAVIGTAHGRPEVARILFESNRSIGKSTDIYAMDADGANVERLTNHPRPNLSPTWSPDGTQFAMATIPAGWFEHIYVLSADGGEKDKKQITNGFKDLSPSWSPDGRRLAVASSIGIWIYDAESGDELNLLKGHYDSVICAAFSPDGFTLASGGADDAVRLWDMRSAEVLHTLNRHGSNVVAVAFSPDGATTQSKSGIRTLEITFTRLKGIHAALLPWRFLLMGTRSPVGVMTKPFGCGMPAVGDPYVR